MAPIQKIGASIRPGQGDLATIQEACPASSNMVLGGGQCYNVALVIGQLPLERKLGEREQRNC